VPENLQVPKISQFGEKIFFGDRAANGTPFKVKHMILVNIVALKRAFDKKTISFTWLIHGWHG
jgi:hypothetical protein